MNINIFIHNLLGILSVVPRTILISILILFLSVILGTIYWRISENNNIIVKNLYRVWISYFRGVPLLIHLLSSYYLIPQILIIVNKITHIGIDINNLNPIYSVIFSYTLYSSCFLEEIIRGSFKSVSKEQIDAARAFGYSRNQWFFFIEVPQALADFIPKLLNYYMLLIRQLSLAFLVSVVDIFAKAKIESALNDSYIESFFAAALVYWGLCILLTFILSKLETSLRRYDRRSL